MRLGDSPHSLQLPGERKVTGNGVTWQGCGQFCFLGWGWLGGLNSAPECPAFLKGMLLSSPHSLGAPRSLFQVPPGEAHLLKLCIAPPKVMVGAQLVQRGPAQPDGNPCLQAPFSAQRQWSLGDTKFDYFIL